MEFEQSSSWYYLSFTRFSYFHKLVYRFVDITFFIPLTEFCALSLDQTYVVQNWIPLILTRFDMTTTQF